MVYYYSCILCSQESLRNSFSVVKETVTLKKHTWEYHYTLIQVSLTCAIEEIAPGPILLTNALISISSYVALITCDSGNSTLYIVASFC